MYRLNNVWAICTIAALGGMLFGFDISSMSGVLGTQAYVRYYHHPLSYRQGGITAAMSFGSLLGSLVSSFLSDRFSRRRSVQAASVVWIIGSIIQTVSVDVAMLVAGRVIAGVGVGLSTAIVPVYQAEIAPRAIRGRAVGFMQWAVAWGICIQYYIQYGASFTGGGVGDPDQGTSAFRIPWAIQTVPATLLFTGLLFCPPSPRWLASKDRWDEALRVLADLHGKGDVNHPIVLAEFQEIEEAIAFEHSNASSSFKELLEPKMLKRVLLGMGVQMWSQFSGINIILYYIVYILEGAGIDNPLLIASIQYIINVTSTGIGIFCVDFWGRRPPLIIGAFSMMSLLFICGAIQAVKGQPNLHPTDLTEAVTWVIPSSEKAASRAVVTFSYLFVVAFTVSWGPVAWLYPSEIFPVRIRAKAVSLTSAVCWVWNAILALFVPALLNKISWKTYMIFGAFNGCACLHMFFTAYETKGNTLEEMDEVFDSGRPAWKKRTKTSRLDELKQRIESNHLKLEDVAVVEAHVENIVNKE